jgi:hypothetical protein
MTRLFYRWLDVVFRKIIPDGYARLGLRQAEETLKGLPIVMDDRTLREAHDALTSLPHPEESMDFLAGIYSVLGSVRPILGSVDLYESCFANIMASRLVYGDDRSTPGMRDDIRVAKETSRQ